MFGGSESGERNVYFLLFGNGGERYLEGLPLYPSFLEMEERKNWEVVSKLSPVLSLSPKKKERVREIISNLYLVIFHKFFLLENFKKMCRRKRRRQDKRRGINFPLLKLLLILKILRKNGDDMERD